MRIHDDGRGHRSREAVDGLQGPLPLRRHPPLEQKALQKGGDFEQPLQVHEHWHMDITFVHVRGIPTTWSPSSTGIAGSLSHGGLFMTMEAGDVGIVQQKALEAFPLARPWFVTDNGKQFVGKDSSSSSPCTATSM